MYSWQTPIIIIFPPSSGYISGDITRHVGLDPLLAATQRQCTPFKTQPPFFVMQSRLGISGRCCAASVSHQWIHLWPHVPLASLLLYSHVLKFKDRQAHGIEPYQDHTCEAIVPEKDGGRMWRTSKRVFNRKKSHGNRESAQPNARICSKISTSHNLYTH